MSPPVILKPIEGKVLGDHIFNTLEHFSLKSIKGLLSTPLEKAEREKMSLGLQTPSSRSALKDLKAPLPDPKGTYIISIGNRPQDKISENQNQKYPNNGLIK